MKKQYITLLAAFSAITLAYGDITAVSNFSESENGSVGINSTSLNATSFTTGDLSGGYELNTIGFQYGDSGGFSGNLNVSLYSSLAGGAPDSLIDENFAPSGDPGDYKEVHLEGAGTIHLDASTKYFVVFDSTVATTVDFTTSHNETFGDAGIVGSGWEIGDWHWRNDGGTGWSSITEHPIRLSIGVIPEPATLSLIALLSGGALLIRRIFMI